MQQTRTFGYTCIVLGGPDTLVRIQTSSYLIKFLAIPKISERQILAYGNMSQMHQALFSSQKILIRDYIALSFLFDKHCPIIK